MYTNIIVLIFSLQFVIFMSGCSKEDIKMNIAENEYLLDIVAPSGEKIANNITELKKETAFIIAETFEIDKTFEITNLNYLPCKKGYIAIIEYLTEDGMKGTYAISKDAEVNYSTDNVILKSSSRLRSSSENGGGGQTKFVCKPHGNCSTCTLQGSYNPNTGENTITCSCNECKMEITVS
ncbi:MAG TPA: hypothetical protein DD421_06115 [Clostridiaceae bacterium]|nr:hypothetical protein [Clostridiaceae bacterium]